MTAQTVYGLGCFYGMIGGLAVSVLQRHPTRRGVWVPVSYLLLAATNLLAVVGGDPWLAGLLAGGGLAIGPLHQGRSLDLLLSAGGGLVVLTTAVWDRPPTTVSVFAAVVCAVMFVESLWSYRRTV